MVLRARVQWSVSKPCAQAPWRRAWSMAVSWACDRRGSGPVGPALRTSSPLWRQRACLAGPPAGPARLGPGPDRCPRRLLQRHHPGRGRLEPGRRRPAVLPASVADAMTVVRASPRSPRTDTFTGSSSNAACGVTDITGGVGATAGAADHANGGHHQSDEHLDLSHPPRPGTRSNVLGLVRARSRRCSSVHPYRLSGGCRQPRPGDPGERR
jgi:hypothetical protein